MGAEISKDFFPYSFGLISTKLYDKHVSSGGI